MEIEQIIEQWHTSNAEKRAAERSEIHPTKLWRLVVPTAAAVAAVVGLIALPRQSKPLAYERYGVYCNSDCSPEEVFSLINDQVDYIRNC